MNTLASRLNEVLAEKEWSQEHLAEHCSRIAEQSDDFDPKDSVSQVAIHKIASGKTKSTRKGPILSAALGVNVQWLLTGQGEKYPRDHSLTGSLSSSAGGGRPMPPSDDYIAIQRVKLRPSAGVTGYTIEDNGDVGKPIFFRADYLATRGWNADNLIALRVNGSSMEPGLYDSDLIVIHTGKTTPIEGRVFVLIYEGETLIKRLGRDMGEWILRSDNADKRRYPDKRLDDEQSRLVGEVVYKQSEVI